MKTISWQSCSSHGAISTYLPATGKMLKVLDVVNPGMKVSAKYRDLHVYLKVKSKVSETQYSATVLSFEPVLASPLPDITVSDDVLIAREFMCCVFDD